MTTETTTLGRPYGQIWRHRTFLLLWSGATASILGDHFFDLALMWYLYVQTRSSLQVAGITVAFQITHIVIGPIAGVFADRWDKRRTMIVADAIRAFIVIGLAVVAWKVGVSFASALVAVFLLEATSRFFSPSRLALMSTIIPKDDIITANGLMSSTRQAMGIAGQTLAGIVISGAGAVCAFIVDAVSFVMSAASLVLIRNTETPPGDADTRSDSRGLTSSHDRKGWRNFWVEMRSGWQVVYRSPMLRAVVAYALVVNLAFAMMAPIVPAYVDRQLGAGAWALGLLEGMQFAGALVGGALTGAISSRIRTGNVLFISTALFGLVMIATGLLHSMPPAVVLWILAGFTLSVKGVVEQSLLQACVPQQLQGRAFAFISATAMALMPVGAVAGGYLANIEGPGLVFLVIGATYTIVALAMLANVNIRSARVGDARSLPS